MNEVINIIFPATGTHLPSAFPFLLYTCYPSCIFLFTFSSSYPVFFPFFHFLILFSLCFSLFFLFLLFQLLFRLIFLLFLCLLPLAPHSSPRSFSCLSFSPSCPALRPPPPPSQLPPLLVQLPRCCTGSFLTASFTFHWFSANSSLEALVSLLHSLVGDLAVLGPSSAIFIFCLLVRCNAK